MRHPRARAPPGAARFVVIIEVIATGGTLPPRGEAARPHAPLRRSRPLDAVIVRGAPSSPETIFTDAAHPFTDSTASPFTGYAYRVEANRATAESSAKSAVDVTVLARYTQPSIAAESLIRGEDIAELRHAIDALRETAGLARSWSDYNPAGGLILASDWSALHARLAEARVRLQELYGVPLIDIGAAPQQFHSISYMTPVLLRRGVE